MVFRVLLASVCVVLLVLSVVGSLRAEGVETTRQETAQAEQELKELENVTSELRGLKFKEKVDYQVMDRSDIRDLLDARLNEDFPPDKLENLSIAYAKLGLIKPGLNLRDAILALYSEQLAAFYDQKKKKLYSIEGLPFSKEFQKVLMAHELTHVLQDQNFDLSTLPLDSKDNDDEALAALSLVEGDATLLFTQYATEKANLSLKDVLASVTMGQKELIEAPYVLRRNLLFPYTEGVQFVTRLFEKGGWESVNRAFKDPPQSTEQILHPEKYGKKRDNPITICLPDFSSLAGKKWELLEDNVLGELNVRILFRQFLGGIRAIKPSRGWGGDRFRVYRAEGKDETLLVLGTVWDTDQDREEFVSCYLEAMKKKYKGKNFETNEGQDQTCLAASDVVIWLGWSEKKALVIEAPDKVTLLATVWEFVKAGGGPRITQSPSPPNEEK